MTMITPSYLGETIEYSSLHACRSTLEDPTGMTVVMVTHERALAERYAQRLIFLADGKLVSDEANLIAVKGATEQGRL